MMQNYVNHLWDYFDKFRHSKLSKVFFWDVLSKGSDFVFLPLYLKILTQAEYGFYTYTIYIITTLSGILNLGLDTSLSKMYYETENDGRKTMLFSINIIWFLFFAVVFLFCLITSIDNILLTEVLNVSLGDYRQIRFFIFGFVLFKMIQNTLNIFFVIDDNSITYQKYNLFRTLIGNSIVLIILAYFTTGNKAYFRLYLEPIFFFLSFIPLIIIFIKRMKFKINWKFVKDSLTLGMPIMGSVIVGVVYNISDKYFLQKSNGYDTLAVYNLTLFLTLPISLVFMSFSTIWMPIFFKEHSSIIRFRDTNKYFVRLTLFYLILLILIESILIIGVKLDFLKSEYTPIIYIYPIVFVAKVMENLFQLYNNFIIAWNKTLFNLLISVLFSVITLVLNFLIIPEWGLYGAITTLFLLSATRLIIFYTFVQSNINHKNDLKFK